MTPAASEIIEWYSSDKYPSHWNGDNALKGIKILEKYTDKDVIRGAGHDIIFSIDLDESVENGISEHDVIQLLTLNWMIHEGYAWACFV